MTPDVKTKNMADTCQANKNTMETLSFCLSLDSAHKSFLVYSLYDVFRESAREWRLGWSVTMATRLCFPKHQK